MAHFLSKVLDAILANVELTIVTSTVRFKAYTFVLKTTKNEENRTMGTLDISF